MPIDFRSLERALLDLVYPPHCVSCGRDGDLWCRDCRRDVPLITPPFCARCGQPVPASERCASCAANPALVDGVRSVASFEGSLRKAIHAFKYEGLTALSQPLGEFLAQGWERFHPEGELIVPVPLHASRRRQRGYNQSALLARELGRRSGLPVAEDVLTRCRQTMPQVDLGIRQRWENVQGAFQGRDDVRIRQTAVLLVDDVCTTGATLAVCAQALRLHGASSVWGLTLARAA